jgi:hypothetical protein
MPNREYSSFRPRAIRLQARAWPVTAVGWMQAVFTDRHLSPAALRVLVPSSRLAQADIRPFFLV